MATEDLRQTVQSPCIGICRLNTAKVCLGCGRTAGEVGEWLAASESRRLAICRAAVARLKDLPTSQLMVSDE
ncbi:MAG TPA: DUF1289 domain-containing protein [Steroidobacteraceae bacterium]|jgi:predicted Fe-S protein YdhL (DUF1289 family)|nr:DUF1289 domain-containing protein [Steroidobacteraceae bacterium]